jgi:type I restriction enzyme S subunit
MLKPVDNSVDIKFIFSLMNLINFSLGDEHKRRWIGEYSKQIIYVPKIDEQRAISSMIDDMTFELHELILKRKKYQAIKQGMMQELLTGKTRLV